MTRLGGIWAVIQTEDENSDRPEQFEFKGRILSETMQIARFNMQVLLDTWEVILHISSPVSGVGIVMQGTITLSQSSVCWDGLVRES